MEALSPASMAVAMVMALMISEDSKGKQKRKKRKGGEVGDLLVKKPKMMVVDDLEEEGEKTNEEVCVKEKKGTRK